jgi:hypothetical protein
MDYGLLDGKACDAEGRCLSGYVCDPATRRCVRPGGPCPAAAPACGDLSVCRELPPEGAAPDCCPAGACRALDGRLWTEALPAPPGMRVDGDRDDWESFGRSPLTKLGVGEWPTSPEDFSCAFATAWDATGLFVLLECADDVHPAPDSGEAYHEDDCLEVFLDLTPDDARPPYDRSENQLLATREGVLREYAEHAWGWSARAAHAENPGRAWWIEAWVGWPEDQPRPGVGSLLGFDLAADDDDGERDDRGRTRQLFWNDGSGQAYLDPGLFGLLKLRAEGQSPSAPVCGNGACEPGGETAASCPADCD